MKPLLYIGIMSGTSLDGIDTVLVDFAPKTPQVLASVHAEYPHAVRAQLLQLIVEPHADLLTLGRLHTQLGELYAASVLQLLKNSNAPADHINAIGLHGQTIFHAPNDAHHPFTWQLGNAHVVAAQTHIPVIADFRGLDIALGGQGAPLAPIFHLALFGDLHPQLAVLNLGGIANITLIDQQKIIKAFDTGPANCLLDAWMLAKEHQPFDRDGAFARSGKILPRLLNTLLQEPYFYQSAPKSTGRELFNLSWLQPNIHDGDSSQDVAATLTELTAITTTQPLRLHGFQPQELILAGGGADNAFLAERITAHAPCLVTSSPDHCFLAEHIEPVAFAYLAKMHIENKRLALSHVTGAPHAHSCGIMYAPL